MSSAASSTSRRHWLAQAAALAGASTLPALPVFAAEAKTLRIGYQKSSTLTLFLKSRGILEKALAPHQVTVSWHEFTSGLPLLEALNIGESLRTTMACAVGEGVSIA